MDESPRRDDGRAHIHGDGERGVVGVHAAPHAVARLQHDDPPPVMRHHAGGGETRGTGADDHDGPLRAGFPRRRRLLQGTSTLTPRSL